MNFRDFVADNLISQLKELLSEKDEEDKRPKYRYHVFVLIAVGIETIGAALDADAWEVRRKSEKRFNLALSSYESLQKYQNKDIYNLFRCNMVHVYRPGIGLGINCRAEGGSRLHNQIKHGCLVLCVEDLAEDFWGACGELLANIEGKKVNLNISDKAKEGYIGMRFS